jgi:hypothetical protein
MSTSMNEQGRSSDSELFNAIQVVCREVSGWLDQRPELRDATRTILDSILTPDLDAAKSGTPTETECGGSELAETRTGPPSEQIEAVGDIAASDSTDVEDSRMLEDRVEQTILDLASAVDSEMGEDTVLESVTHSSDADGLRTIKPRYSEVSDADLNTMIERCRLKAEGARWAIERDERIRDGVDFKLEVKPHDLEIIDRAKQVPNCFLWMNQPRTDIRVQSQDFQRIADCFDALAESLMTLNVALTTDDAEHFIESVQLVAEAQSALRSAVARVEDHPDTDQQLAYHWLRNRASHDRFYISRFMKITDPADPENCVNVQQQAIELRSQATIGKSNKKRGSWLEQARFHLRKISSDLDSADDYDWGKVANAVDHWVEEGGSVRSRELRELLLPFVDEIPDSQFSANFERAVDVLISTTSPKGVETASTDESQAEPETHKSIEVTADRSLEVKQISNWLQGKRMVLFAGEVETEVYEQVFQSLKLDSLLWISPENHHSEIEKQVDTADLLGVLVTNQWETLLWDEVSELAERGSVPCVRLPTSCNAHQIAVQIIKQCPDNLSGGDIQSSVA